MNTSIIDVDATEIKAIDLPYLDANARETIPLELRDCPHWITWATSERDANGKLPKRPVGRDGSGKSWQHSQQHMTFDDAVEQASRTGLVGVGIVLPAKLADGTWLAVLDFDGVDLSEAGMQKPRIKEIEGIWERLSRSWLEKSAGGSGLHMFLRTREPIKQVSSSKNQLGGADELFCESPRWLAVTGWHVAGSGVPEVTGKLKILADAWRARAGRGVVAPVEDGGPVFDPFAPKPTDRAMQSPVAALAGGYVPPEVVADGAGRETALLKYAGSLRGKGLDQATIERCVSDYNRLHIVPQLSEAVVLDKVRRYAVSDTPPTAPSDWPSLTPLPPKYLNPPKLNTSILPAALAAYVIDAATRMQVPPEMIATPLVISLGSVIGKLLAVQPMARNNDWTEYPNLWGVGILPPAMLKSPAMAAGAMFIQKLEETAQSAHALAMAAWESDDRVRKLEIDNLQGQAKGLVKSGDRAGARRLLDSVQAIKPPIRKRYVIQDTTPEARLDILTDNPNGCMLLQDELDGHMAQLRRDGYENARAQELQFYDGKQDYASDRIKRGSSIAEAPRLAMYGNLQPAKVEKYLRDLKHGGNDDGYVQRLFQLGIQPTIDTAYVLTDRKPEKLAEAKVKQLFDAAASMVPVRDILHGRLQPKVLQFTSDAQATFNTFLTELEGKLRAGKLSPTQAGHVGKYRGTLPKLALIMAYAEDPHATCIDVLALDRAQRLLAFYQAHARRIYAVDTRGAVVSAHELLARIRKGSVPDGFNPRDDVLRREWDGLAKSAELEEALALLVKHGYLKDTEMPTAGRARRAIWIHPDVYPTKGDIRPAPADKAN